jgi:hypothetical protein
MSNEDEFYCGRTELTQTNKNKHSILMPAKTPGPINVPCGTDGNPHECIREVATNVIHGSKFRCRKCNKVFQNHGSKIITITWITE